jgi:hypothetical protein
MDNPKADISVEKQQLLLTRREFLSIGAVGAIGVVFLAELAQAIGSEIRDSLVYRLNRDVDLMQLEVCFIRFRRKGNDLEPIGSGDSLVALRFPPQNLAEAIFDEVPNAEFETKPLPTSTKSGDTNREGDNNPLPPVTSYLSGPSWVVFAVKNSQRFPLDNVEAWFALLATCNLKVPRGALPPEERGPYKPTPPRQDETRLEIPYRLYISPEPDVRTIFSKFSSKPLSGQYTEMWQAALESRHPVKPAPPPPGTPNLPEELKPPSEVVLHSRAIWSPDYRQTSEPVFSLYYPGYQPLSLHALTRHRLVKQMGDGDGWIDAEHLILTALGADASFHYSSQKPVDQIIEEQLQSAKSGGNPGTELRIWKHRIVIGRDVFFAEAFFGFLFPFCHPSIYVEITKRKPAAYEKGSDVGPLGYYLLKRRFILVQDPAKQFADSSSPIGREMPLKSAKIVSLRSPDLDKPDNQVSTGIAFWPVTVDKKDPVNWDIDAQDESGRIARSTHAELFFASNIVAGQEIYNATPAAKRAILFPGSKLALANEEAKIELATLEGSQDEPVAVSFEPEELPFIERLSEELKSGPQPPDELAEFGKKLEDLREKVENKLPSLVEGAAEKATERLKKIQDHLKKAGPERAAKLFKDFRQKLESVSKIGAALEIHAMEFKSKCIRDYSTVAEQCLKELKDAATKDAKDILEAAQKAIDNAPDDVKSATEEARVYLKKQTKLVAAQVSGEVQNRLASLAKKAEQLGFKDSDLKELKDFLKDFDEFPELKKTGAELKAKATPILKKLDDFVDRQEKELEKNIRREIGAAKEDLDKLGQKLQGRLNQLHDEIVKARKQAQDMGSGLFHAAMESANVVIPALKDALPDAPQRAIKMFDDYVAGGIRNVQNGVFAKLDEAINTGEKLAQGLKNGIAQPAAVIAGLSREMGAVVGDGEKALKEIARQVEDFDIKGAIPDSKLFGVIPLRELISLVSRGELPNINRIELPEKIENIWQWSTTVSSKKFGILDLQFNTDKGSKNRLFILSKTTLVIPRPAEIANGQRPDPQVRLHGWLGRWNEQAPVPPKNKDDTFREDRLANKADDWAVAIVLLQLIRVRFGYVTFDASYASGRAPSPSVDVDFRKVEFLGPLKFIAELQKSFTKFGKFSIEPAPKGLRLSHEFELPPISFGAFSMRCLRLTNKLSLPFGSAPLEYNFALASFAKPFEISVMGFAGRGYLSVGFRTDGYRLLEGALEFGGSLAFNFGGVASGGLYLMAGAYFKITNNETLLSGYIRAGGNLDVLGLIHANVEFMLMLSYRDGKNGGSELYGTCTITVSIDLFLYSMDVSITMKKHIAGSKSDSGESIQDINNAHRAIAFIERGELTKADAHIQSLSEPYLTELMAVQPGQLSLMAVAMDAGIPRSGKQATINKLAAIKETEKQKQAKNVGQPKEKGRPYIRRGKETGYQFESPSAWRSEYWEHFAN